MTAISIAFCLDSIPVVGVVFAPFLGLHGTLYSAVLGVGAWMAEANYDARAYPPPVRPSSSEENDEGEEEEEEEGLDYVPIELPIISPPPPLPSNAPNGCLYLSEWGKDRRPGDNMNLAKKRESFYNMAVGSGGELFSFLFYLFLSSSSVFKNNRRITEFICCVCLCSERSVWRESSWYTKFRERDNGYGICRCWTG